MLSLDIKLCKISLTQIANIFVAQYNFRLCLRDNIGVDKNIEEAFRYFELAVANGFEPAKDLLAVRNYQ